LSIWVKSERLALAIFPTTVAAENLLAESQQAQLFALAVSIIGITMIAEAIPALVYNAGLFLVSRNDAYSSVFGFGAYGQNEPLRIWSVTATASVLAAFVRALIGFGLLLGTTRLLEFVTALRRDQEPGD
jgi:hypothetical protein